jgi:mannose-6-phosphate isomerase
MTAKRLTTHRVEKPWGRHRLWPGFADPPADGEPIGEIWFQDEGDDTPELLVKYLFTAEKLSIQVHPDDAAARASGHARGKDEAWVILDAEPDSTIAIGTRAPVSHETLRAAALDGSIETLVDWKPVKAGEVYYSPAGTVHAIGAGITVVEVQQNVDLTYRLYDYGRPRELHLDAGIAVSDAIPLRPQLHPRRRSARTHHPGGRAEIRARALARRAGPDRAAEGHARLVRAADRRGRARRPAMAGRRMLDGGGRRRARRNGGQRHAVRLSAGETDRHIALRGI